MLNDKDQNSGDDQTKNNQGDDNASKKQDDFNKDDNKSGEGENEDKKGPPKSVPYGEFSDTRKELKKAREALEKINKEKKETEEKDLAEKGKYKELAEAKQKEIDTLKTQVEGNQKYNVFAEKALKEGVVSTGDAFKLADLSDVKIENGEVKGINEVIEKLKTDKPFLFNEDNRVIGSGTNPAGQKTQDGKKVYRQSEIDDWLENNREEYKKHENDISKAYAEGRVTDN